VAGRHVLAQAVDEAAVLLPIGGLDDHRQVRLSADAPVDLIEGAHAGRRVGQKFLQAGANVAEKLNGQKQRRQGPQDQAHGRGPRTGDDLGQPALIGLDQGGAQALGRWNTGQG
jgi:hypothetical protein